MSARIPPPSPLQLTTVQVSSHFPAVPPPVAVPLTVLATGVCPYNRQRTSQLRALSAGRMDGSIYHDFMNAGFRRSGRMVYQPVCPGCRRCVQIRMPVAQFSLSKSQRHAWDPDLNQRRLVPFRRGVQGAHSTGSFRWDSQCRNQSPISGFLRVPISQSLAWSLESQIMLRLGSGFPSGSLRDIIHPANQKGVNGTYTCVGLIEWAAEEAGHNGGQGLVPNLLEQIAIPGFPTVGTLSPELMEKAVRVDLFLDGVRNVLQGVFDPVDFIITDRFGRRTGYTAASGLLEEIPGMEYSGNGVLENLVLVNPEPGPYQVMLVGLGQHALAAIGESSTGAGFYFEGFLASGEVRIGSFVVPGLCLGDADGDGMVGFPDITSVLREWGTAYPGGTGPGDANADGSVGFPDITEILRLWGEGCP